MKIGLLGLGRMGAGIARRLMGAGHAVVGADADPAAVAGLTAEGLEGASDAADLARRLHPPRIVWLMVPATAVGEALEDLLPHLAPGDLLVDGGNSHFRDTVERGERLAEVGVELVDVGTSGGIFGREAGYCLMVGGPAAAVARLEPALDALAPGVAAAARTAGRTGEPAPEERGWLHCGGTGAGHYVKMVHNAIEYGLMAAYAEGFALLERGSAGLAAGGAPGELAPYRFDLPLDRIAELWRRGSVIRSWLLDLAAAALRADPGLAGYRGRVGDSGEGRWALRASLDLGVPMPVTAAALFDRFESRGEGEFAHRLLSALRHAFGGHEEPCRR